MIDLRTILLPGVAALASVLHAGSYETLAPHLDLDGEFVGYIDFDGDGATLGAGLNEIYRDILAQNPQMMPVPLDFVALFDTLGFGSLKSVGASGKRLEDGFYVNRFTYLLDGPPAGLFALYGDAGDSFAGFRAADEAPADATAAMSGTLDLPVLRETVVAILSQVMGEMGEAMVRQQTAQPIPGTDVSFDELIDTLGGRIDAAWKQEWNEDLTQTYTVRARFAGAGPLLERLRPLGAQMPVVFTDGDKGPTADFSALFPDQPFGLYLHAPAGTDDLLLYTHPEWTVEKTGGSLADSDAFKKYAAGLPGEALLFSYSAGFDMEPVFASMAGLPEAAPYIPVARKAFDLFWGGFLKPNAAFITIEDGIMHNVQYAGYSTKHAVVVMPVAVGGGLMAAMAIPAFQKVRQTSQEKAALNNLRQIASAADQYFLEEGVTEVTYEQLVGPDAYIRSIEPVAGEVYEGMVITTEMDEISVTLQDGRVISIPF